MSSRSVAVVVSVRRFPASQTVPPVPVTVCVNHGCEVWNSLWCLQTMNCFAPLTWLDAYTVCGCLQSEQVVVSSTGRCGRSRHRRERERERERGELGRNLPWRCTNNFSGVTALSSTAPGWLRLSWLSNMVCPASSPVLEHFKGKILTIETDTTL